MTSLLTAFLILVPAPAADEEPTGPARTLQFLKWNKGAFETTRTITEYVPQTYSVTVNVNGQQMVQTRTVNVPVMKIVRIDIAAKVAEVFDLDGKKIDESSWQKTFSPGAVTIVAQGQLPHPAFRKVFKEGTLIVVIKATEPNPGPPNIPVPNIPKP